MKDLLLSFNEFATDVGAALNRTSVAPSTGDDGDLFAVMIIVGNRVLGPPLGGTFNYDPEKMIWELAVEEEFAEKIAALEHIHGTG